MRSPRQCGPVSSSLLLLLLVTATALISGARVSVADELPVAKSHHWCWFGRNLGVKAGSSSLYPDKCEGGYYYPSYTHGGDRCFGYTPAYFPGQYPGIYGGYDFWRKGASGCDANDR
jgi:hypothetical protein